MCRNIHIGLPELKKNLKLTRGRFPHSLGCEASLEAGGREDQADELDEEESRARPEHQRPQCAREHAAANR